ncbi:MAG: PKD domain-containing protein [Bacteroidales bacterium]|nr:PKD domain-containing protein [Bacteroidales bacterium]
MMKKKYLLNLTLAILVPFFFFSCEEDVDPPQPDFSATVSTTGDISITFSDLSSKSPDSWLWTFEGGNPSTSTEQNPTVTYSSHGTFDVTLVATNEGGENEVVKYDYINVVQFNNPLFTDNDVTVDGITKTMSPGSSVQFAKIDNTSVSYTAETAGKTSGGTILGEELYWDRTVDLTSSSEYDLGVSSDFIFFYITNPSGYSLNPFYVNYDNSDQTMDNIIIPGDGVKYKTGYYYTNYGMQIRAYFVSHPLYSYIYWIRYPTTENNQSMSLTTSKSEKGQSEKAIEQNSLEPEMLYPALENSSKTVFNPGAKKMFQSNKK